ncbi:ribosome maturation factor RimM [Leucobacter chromiireducens]|uniref:Ribosome maturation factor RimM n=1 Tax=Leucobacter chromiireducens subsp. chromiireducens TaxID=660067 RepID=A0ABS1STT5_9MICO|nr:ribosome maturation factor RimM [Leucobacter chromiireducens]MBL3690919.1 ribosome maturation factor RimM [Leucobacter chromiireducens subsp. chromiireducens]
MAGASGRAHAPRPASGAGSLRVGRLTKPHGLKGGIKLELFTDNPELRFVPGAEFYLQVPEESPWFGRTITLRELRWFNDSPVGFFAELPDRTAAEGIVRAILWIDEDAVADGEEENAWYHHQLVGLDVVEGERKLGVVAEVQHFPAQDLLVVTTETGAVLVPFVEQIVPSVDIEAGVVHVTPPAGLFVEREAEIAGGPDAGQPAARVRDEETGA